MKLFYTTLIYLTRFELWLAKRAPVRNTRYIERLNADKADYERSLIMTRVNT
jgi:hypothetical protein